MYHIHCLNQISPKGTALLTANYENVSKTLDQWTHVGSTYSYTTGFAPESGTYHYTIQFYNGGSLIGSTSGYFTKQLGEKV